MGLHKGQLTRDAYLDYSFGRLMCRYEHESGKFYCKFYGKAEVEVPHDNPALNEALLRGTEIDRDTYERGAG